MLAGDFGEVGTAFDGGLQFVALGFAGNQDVAGGGSGHGGNTPRVKRQSLADIDARTDSPRPEEALDKRGEGCLTRRLCESGNALR